VGSATLPIFSALILGSKFWGIGVGDGSLPPRSNTVYCHRAPCSLGAKGIIWRKILFEHEKACESRFRDPLDK